jgi:SAM-dependent methyltransferase
VLVDDFMSGSQLNLDAESFEQLAADLRAGQPVGDARFDRLLPHEWQLVSQVHWSPVDVVRRVVSLLAPTPAERVLDIGSGIGKFCVIGALATRSTFLGVEQRPHLVRQALRLAESLGATRTGFVCRDAFSLDWSVFDCIYLYNPFGELDSEGEGEGEGDQRIDTTLDVNGASYVSCVETTQQKLDEMPVGTRVATFHGFGGDMPESYDLQTVEQVKGGALALWHKV